jgi:uncharacterized protein (TIGR03000 family)
MFKLFLKASSLIYPTMMFLMAALSTGNAWADETAAGRQRAEIIMNVPLDAIIFVDGQRISSGGTTRLFVTPPLAPGRRYFYDVKVSWIDGSHARETSRHVSFQAGQRVVLNIAEPNPRAALREARWDLYFDPAAPNPSGMRYYQDPLGYPYFINPSYVTPTYRFYPR